MARLWACLLRGEDLEDTSAEAAAPWAARLSDAVSAPLAGFFLQRAGAPLRQVGPSQKAVSQALLLNRHLKANLVHLLAEIEAAGCKVVLIKGAACAFHLYPTPELRLTPASDVDLLVVPADRRRVEEVLQRVGLRPQAQMRPMWERKDAAGSPPWLDGQGVLNVDLHDAPDVWPLSQALSAAQVMAQARPLEEGGRRLWVPDLTHLLAIQLSNLAKDKFSPLSARRFLDTCGLIRKAKTDAPDELIVLAHFLARARLAQAAACWNDLVAGLGLGEDFLLPAPSDAPWPQVRRDRALYAAWATLALNRPGPFTALAREWRTYPHDVAARLLFRRLAGMLRA